MYVCYSRSKNESHAKAVLYHLKIGDLQCLKKTERKIL